MPLDALQSGESVVQILEMACQISHKAILKFDSLRQEVYTEFTHYQQVAGVQVSDILRWITLTWSGRFYRMDFGIDPCQCKERAE